MAKKKISLTFKRRKTSRWFLEWLEDEQVWAVYGPIGVMSGHSPIIDQMFLFEKTEEDWEDFMWALQKLRKMSASFPEPIFIKDHPKYGDEERAKRLLNGKSSNPKRRRK